MSLIASTSRESAVVLAVLAALDALRVERRCMTLDSRTVHAGDVFVAVPGAHADGRHFVDAALQSGAAAVLCEADDAASGVASAIQVDTPRRIIQIPALRQVMGDIAAAFYGYPSRVMRVYGVTGTNGKTSIANWLAQALDAAGSPCAAIGTLGVSLGTRTWATRNTTPDAVHLQTILRDLRAAGATQVAMEVSSHALELHRVRGVDFHSAIFTNLTQDHLDFHGTMAAYGAAKAKLFTDFALQHRVINADDAFGAELLTRGLRGAVSYGLNEGACVDLRGKLLAMTAHGMTLDLVWRGEVARIDTALIGRFNASNLLAVAGTLLADGVPLHVVADRLTRLTAAPGRMQRVTHKDAAEHGAVSIAPAVYVDYAHTPDALAKAIDTVRETAPASLAVVFGCGGDRDRSKRPLMGAIAATRADRVVVTSDNPRSEPPEAIIADIVAGIDPERRSICVTVPARRDAIARAIGTANAADAVLIAGKGHETYQEVNGLREPFSDVTEARAALCAWVDARQTVTPQARGGACVGR
ncbi:MAG: UDP-N-acetylmuramoyl-L-alanyl-D-glutamate--2,6-diaminopimelate ligase [Burkholderiales bacterium]|nr:UDP-N-acetylmuramoyl-L-alanyl-D-glutamate--2,6-diaminopimelate ligase [Burkholderiales bacterium]